MGEQRVVLNTVGARFEKSKRSSRFSLYDLNYKFNKRHIWYLVGVVQLQKITI
jgi:hypothetical protein